MPMGRAGQSASSVFTRQPKIWRRWHLSKDNRGSEEQRMDLGINGKIAFVAGGSQGMGAAAASILAAEGCRVAVVARNQERIDHAVEAIRSDGGMASGISADLATTAGINAAVEGVRSAFGPTEIVVAQTHALPTALTRAVEGKRWLVRGDHRGR